MNPGVGPRGNHQLDGKGHSISHSLHLSHRAQVQQLAVFRLHRFGRFLRILANLACGFCVEPLVVKWETTPRTTSSAHRPSDSDFRLELLARLFKVFACSSALGVAFGLVTSLLCLDGPGSGRWVGSAECGAGNATTAPPFVGLFLGGSARVHFFVVVVFVVVVVCFFVVVVFVLVVFCCFAEGSKMRLLQRMFKQDGLERCCHPRT